ncbi:MAG: hypothetical protein WA376_00270 [Terrimicrobiaceae bacterium]
MSKKESRVNKVVTLVGRNERFRKKRLANSQCSSAPRLKKSPFATLRVRMQMSKGSHVADARPCVYRPGRESPISALPILGCHGCQMSGR